MKYSFGRVEVTWTHDAPITDKVAVFCGICVHLSVKGVGELLSLSKRTIETILKKIFIKLGGNITVVERGSVKVYLELKRQKCLLELLLAVEERTLHQSIATAIEEESEKFRVFCGEKVHVDPDHFIITIQTLTGTTIQSRSYESYLHLIEGKVWLTL